ncbi:hypothetical protein GGP41_006886 [Bipolaris sorokiniana]|uniref:Uncharacterized protein n=1 Tax=Cochliobolus sativus TaxID=45130 RepID=A0A8H6E0B9_COCSA|nr:hypothetical protein GGP41_006886 [Bipolaris sorokiniana]
MKRAHAAPKKAAHKAHKRQKVDDFPKPLPTKTKRRVQLNELGWKAVSMPDRLEDTEGFYGLEEIDDVEIVKDPVTGAFHFETTKTEDEVARDVEEAWQREEDEARHLEKITFGETQEAEKDEDKESEEDEGKEPKVQGEDEELEWEGFSDEEIETETPTLATNGEDQEGEKQET